MGSVAYLATLLQIQPTGIVRVDSTSSDWSRAMLRMGVLLVSAVATSAKDKKSINSFISTGIMRTKARLLRPLSCSTSVMDKTTIALHCVYKSRSSFICVDRGFFQFFVRKFRILANCTFARDDIYFVRRGRSLERYLSKGGPKIQEAIQGRIVYWNTPTDILSELVKII